MSYEGSYIWSIRKKIGSDMLLMPGASIMVRDPRGRILLTKRTDNGEWCNPGGAVEVGSTFLSTAVTELAEETLIQTAPESLVPFACLSHPDWHTVTYPGGNQSQAFAMCFLLENYDGPLAKNGDENSAMDFFDLNDLPSPLMRPTVKLLEILQKYLETEVFQVF